MTSSRKRASNEYIREKKSNAQAKPLRFNIQGFWKLASPLPVFIQCLAF